jgi:hypothetical protein
MSAGLGEEERRAVDRVNDLEELFGNPVDLETDICKLVSLEVDLELNCGGAGALTMARHKLGGTACASRSDAMSEVRQLRQAAGFGD